MCGKPDTPLWWQRVQDFQGMRPGGAGAAVAAIAYVAVGANQGMSQCSYI